MSNIIEDSMMGSFERYENGSLEVNTVVSLKEGKGPKKYNKTRAERNAELANMGSAKAQRTSNARDDR